MSSPTFQEELTNIVSFSQTFSLELEVLELSHQHNSHFLNSFLSSIIMKALLVPTKLILQLQLQLFYWQQSLTTSKTPKHLIHQCFIVPISNLDMLSDPVFIDSCVFLIHSKISSNQILCRTNSLEIILNSKPIFFHSISLAYRFTLPQDWNYKNFVKRLIMR